MSREHTHRDKVVNASFSVTTDLSSYDGVINSDECALFKRLEDAIDSVYKQNDVISSICNDIGRVDYHYLSKQFAMMHKPESNMFEEYGHLLKNKIYFSSAATHMSDATASVKDRKHYLPILLSASQSNGVHMFIQNIRNIQQTIENELLAEQDNDKIKPLLENLRDVIDVTEKSADIIIQSLDKIHDIYQAKYPAAIAL